MNESVNPAKRDFTCTKCGKYLQIIGLAYAKAYEGHDTCLSCRTTVKPDKVLTEEELGSFEACNGSNTYEATVINKLITSHRALNSRNGKLVLENDELMAENAKLILLLNRTLPYIEPEIEQSGYGAFPGGNPNLFTPDSENSWLEIENWKMACDKWNAGNHEGEKGSHRWLMDSNDNVIGTATVASLGFGIYRYQNEEAKDICSQIKALEELNHE